MPPVEVPKMKHADKTIARKRAYTSRAMADFKAWLAANA
jgi:hypothetical protein